MGYQCGLGHMRRSASTYVSGTINLAILAGWSDDEDTTAISTATSTNSNAARKRDASAISNAAPPMAKAMPRNSTIAPRSSNLAPSVSKALESRSVVEPPAQKTAKVELAERRPPSTCEPEYCLLNVNTEAMLRVLKNDIGDLLVHERPRIPWPQWETGIINLNRCRVKFPIKEGHILRQAVSDARKILARARCEYKVGIATSVAQRWNFYQAPDAPWQPSHLFVLSPVKNRSEATYLESGIIAVLEVLYAEKDLSINIRNKDYGGGGARWTETAEAVHFVYLAVKAEPDSQKQL